MKKIILFGILIAAVMFLSSCTVKCPDCICECPSIPECPTLDCDSCPSQTETVSEEVIVLKYVCESGEVVEQKDDCLYIPPSDIVLVKTNEDGTSIINTSVTSACVYGYNGGAIYFKRGSVPDSIEYQLKEADEFKTAYVKSQGVYEKIEYFSVCRNCCEGIFSVLPDKVYVLRIKFNMRRSLGSMQYEDYTEYSNEYLIDTTKNSGIMLKTCALN